MRYRSSRRDLYALSTEKIAAISDSHYHVHNSTVASSHHRHDKRADDFNDLVCKGKLLLDKIRNDPPSEEGWEVYDFKPNGWRKSSDVFEYVAPKDLESILGELGIPHGPNDVLPVQWYQDLPFVDDNGHANTVYLFLFPCDDVLTAYASQRPTDTTTTTSSRMGEPSSPSRTTRRAMKPAQRLRYLHFGADLTSFGCYGLSRWERNAQRS